MDGQGLSAGAKLTPVTVLVVDDHPALRAGLRSLIDSDPALRVLAEVESGEAAYAAYRKHLPDTVVMDLSMEGFGGIEAIRRIRSFDPEAAVLVYSVHDSQAVALAVQKELESRSENGDRLVAESLEVELNQALRAQAAA
ncbi:MAG: response regulator transcription factor [Accumulibacter sp.]|jgi:DNA-binding NarL/FixJ family response regulator|uniref:response regulator n=1 Tax=Accumulibacter sp. TaxID=2053492 RepID=UPI002FC351AE